MGRDLFFPLYFLADVRYRNDFGGWFSVPAESKACRSADMRHPFGIKAGKACTPGATRAGVYDACRAVFQQLFSERLRSHVTCWIEASRETRRAAQIVELTSEIGKIVVELDFILVTPHFGQVDGFVKSNLRLRRSQLKSRIPCAAICVIETAAQRMRVGEGSVDNSRVRYAGNQFVWTDSGQQSTLGKHSFIGHAAERNEILELRACICKLFQWVGLAVS